MHEELTESRIRNVKRDPMPCDLRHMALGIRRFSPSFRALSGPSGPRTKSSESTGHRYISPYSYSSSSGHQPSRDVTGICLAHWYCLSRARQLSRSCWYRSDASAAGRNVRASAANPTPAGLRPSVPCSPARRSGNYPAVPVLRSVIQPRSATPMTSDMMRRNGPGRVV